MTRRINAKGHVEPVEVVGERYCLLEDVRLALGHRAAHVVGVGLGEGAEVVGGELAYGVVRQLLHGHGLAAVVADGLFHKPPCGVVGVGVAVGMYSGRVHVVINYAIVCLLCYGSLKYSSG